MRLLLALLAPAVAAFLLVAAANADEGDASKLEAGTVLIGQQATLDLDVATPPGATVEVDAGAAGWNGVEVIRVEETGVDQQGGVAIHHLRLTVAGFLPGPQAFTPTVNIVNGPDITPRTLPDVSWEVTSSLAPDAPLELSPLPEPSAIGGGESPFLRPAIGAGIVAGVLLIAGLAWLVGSRVARRLRRAPPPLPEPARGPSLEGVASLLHADPVAAYRSLAAIVRGFIAEQYGFPAHALTTGELQQRMEAQGVDRWQARLVGGLLEECDSVVYAGYRPAPERREADLTVAEEILGAV